MKLEGQGKLLRVFLGESDKSDRMMLYDAIIRNAREAGLAGATAFRGIEGFGAHSRIHTAKILRLSEDLPVLVEIVDTEEKIRKFIPVVDRLFLASRCGGMMTIENVEVVRYAPGEGNGTA